MIGWPAARAWVTPRPAGLQALGAAVDGLGQLGDADVMEVGAGGSHEATVRRHQSCGTTSATKRSTWPATVFGRWLAWLRTWTSWLRRRKPRAPALIRALECRRRHRLGDHDWAVGLRGQPRREELHRPSDAFAAVMIIATGAAAPPRRGAPSAR
jgi:hypothetical protein